MIRSSAAARELLAGDCETLDDMAKAYIAKFQARLDWEAAHPPSSTAATADNPTPATLLDMIGEDAVRAIIEERRRRRGSR